LANPQRHTDFDGSGMLWGAVLDRPISDVGDTFTMKMHRLGDDYLWDNASCDGPHQAASLIESLAVGQPNWPSWAPEPLAQRWPGEA
jgi:hypothetical protein